MSMKKTYITLLPSRTKYIGERLAKKILEGGIGKKATILLLRGDLGGGKTTFLKGFAKGLGIEREILSPTFIIVRKFPLKSLSFHSFYHLDCYRINFSRNIKEIGIKKILNDPFNIVAIEWPQRIINLIKKPYFEIRFSILSPKKREIVVEYKE